MSFIEQDSDAVEDYKDIAFDLSPVKAKLLDVVGY